MKQTFFTFILAISIYAIITLPVITVPMMYGYSMLLAVGFGIPAWLVFSLVFLLTKHLKLSSETKWLILILAVPFGVAIAYTLIDVFGVWRNVWSAGWLMLFPLAATVSGWISVYKTRNIIDENINPDSQEYSIY